MRRSLLAAAALVVATFGGGALLGGCLTPPALMKAPEVDADTVLTWYPEGAETVELDLPDGPTLRGIFVPSDEGAPVVLHLLESSGSVASRQMHYVNVAQQLSDLGFASLAIDYTGIGASSGSRSPRRLARDARAMWDEAVRRAGGDEKRVAIRAISIGTLATAHLLQDGVAPAAVVQIVPVRAETATRRFAGHFYNGFVGWMVGCLFRPVTGVDIVEAYAGSRVPILGITADDELFLHADERERMAAAVEASRGTWISRPGGHLIVAGEAHRLLPEEIEAWVTLAEGHADARAEARLERWLQAMTPERRASIEADPAWRERLLATSRHVRGGDPELFAAVTRGIEDPVDAARVFWQHEHRSYPQAISFDDLADAVACDMPEARRFVDLWIGSEAPMDLAVMFGAPSFNPAPGMIASDTDSLMAGLDAGWLEYVVELGGRQARVRFDPSRIRDGLLDVHPDRAEVRRQLALAVLRAYRYPARIAEGPGGSGDRRVEVKSPLSSDWWPVFED